MSDPQIKKIALQLSLKEKDVQATISLLDSGASLPFIARYRKEATGNLDEVAIAAIRESLFRLRRMEERRESIIESLAKRSLLTDDLQERLLGADTLESMEDIYLPFRIRRKTRATAARERGLEPLARTIFAQDNVDWDPEEEALVFVNPEKGVSSAEQALSGARDIMAEWMSEDGRARQRMRSLYQSQGIIRSAGAAGKGEDAAKYRDYLDRSEPISRLRPHRILAILAMLRGAKSGALSLHIAPPEQAALGILEELFIKGDGPLAQQVRQAAMDSYRRLLAPSMENETLSRMRVHAGEKAIEIFSQNLRQALLEPPLGQKSVLALDPGFRTGCKLAVIDSLGRLQENQEIFPHDTGKRREEAAASVRDICKRRGIEAIAVGNGTAGRETEEFLRGLDLAVPIIMVNESGASVYSTSEIARREFPHKDATVRSAVSIGRRLMDPLAELVKIDPKAIGVGEYQHDVDQSALKSALDDVAASCVNLVGVDLNTASRELLAYVSGLGLKTAEAVVNYRNEHGLFRSRKDLLKVPRLGPKAFEQSAGFLRIHNGHNPLDGTAVHPESYPIVEKMAEDCGVGIRELMNNEDLLRKLVKKMEDLRAGMKLPGIVTNVTAFGAFVDIGVHQDGLVHISQLRDCYVRNPTEVVKVRQKVTVEVLDVDLERKRISLSMRHQPTRQ
ncbi:MAG: RNA-binding transcriptional accessory protein [Methanothrix sp.]|nr:RNA-binding transcriptional accessory protein [Methanothrix sp.]OYV10318.1 MAG: uncharacterized protein CG437_359 [Methanosaeta sp. NSP1]